MTDEPCDCVVTDYGTDLCVCGHDVTDHGINFGCIYCDCEAFHPRAEEAS